MLLRHILFANFLLDVLAVGLAVFGSPHFREIITHSVASELACPQNMFFADSACGLYTRTLCAMILSLGIVRLFGALDVFNHRMLNLTILSYVMEFVWFSVELFRGTYSTHVSIAECTKLGKTSCDLRTVVGAMGLCTTAIFLIIRQKQRINEVVSPKKGSAAKK